METRTEPMEPGWSAGEVTAFYGVCRRVYYEMQKTGAEAGVRVPWEDPLALRDWFVDMKQRGLRRAKAPPQIMLRIEEAEALQVSGATRLSRELPVTNEEIVPAPADEESAPVSVPGKKRGALAPIEDLRREIQELMAQKKAATNEPARKILATALERRRNELRHWELSAAKIRKSDAEESGAIRRQMAGFAAGLWRLLRREIMSKTPAEERPRMEAQLNSVAEAVPGLMIEFFGAGAEEALNKATP